MKKNEAWAELDRELRTGEQGGGQQQSAERP